MKTYINPEDTGADIGEFIYEGCRYSGIKKGLIFSVLSVGLANFLEETFTFLQETEPPEFHPDNENCCRKCGRDCKSTYMRDRHEKVCTENKRSSSIILKPIHIFWNYKNLDKTQLAEEMLIPTSTNNQPDGLELPILTESEVAQPMPGVARKAMIGKREQDVVTDRDGIDWYGEGVTDDTP